MIFYIQKDKKADRKDNATVKNTDKEKMFI